MLTFIFLLGLVAQALIAHAAYQVIRSFEREAVDVLDDYADAYLTARAAYYDLKAKWRKLRGRG